MKNSLIAGTPSKDMTATTQLETVDVNAKKCYIYVGNQQPSPCKMGKVQRSGDIPHRFQVESKSESPRTGEDMIRSCKRLQE